MSLFYKIIQKLFYVNYMDFSSYILKKFGEFNRYLAHQFDGILVLIFWFRMILFLSYDEMQEHHQESEEVEA